MQVDRAFTQKLISLRRQLHKHPELSWQEAQTAQRICQVLDELGIIYRRGVAKHGILAEIPAKATKPFIALRTDMDALPIHEETGLEFSSTNNGVMHACGHDGHMTILIGAAELLLRGEKLPYPVRLVFQPAEEDSGGARKMIEEGALEDVAMIFGGHLDRIYESGTLVINEGTVNASTDEFVIHVRGKGGHGGRPHEGTDAIVAASMVVTSLQTLVSREVNPACPAVVSIGEFKAGTAANIIAGEAFLRGTLRAHHPDVRKQLTTGLSRIARSICESYGAKADLALTPGSPPLINTKEMCRLSRAAAAQVVGKDHVKEFITLNMGGEDFSEYLEHVPGSYIRYGAQIPGRENYPAHTSRFDFNEETLPIAASYLATVAKLACKKLAEERGA